MGSLFAYMGSDPERLRAALLAHRELLRVQSAVAPGGDSEVIASCGLGFYQGGEVLLQRRPRELSGGQRQRVAMGRAIVRQPQVFLFDEPLSNLDAKLRAELRRELKLLHRTLGATMIYVTHDQVEAMTMGERICVLKDGVIQQVDTPTALYDRPANAMQEPAEIGAFDIEPPHACNFLGIGTAGE